MSIQASQANKHKRKRVHRLLCENYVFGLPNVSDSSDYEDSSFQPNEDSTSISDISLLSVSPKDSTCDESSVKTDSCSSDLNFDCSAVEPKKSEYVEAILSSILVCRGVCLASCEKIVSLFNMYLNRFFPGENQLPNIRYFWDKRAKTNSIGVYTICEYNHFHGPFFGEPKNFGSMVCGEQNLPVSLEPNKYFLHILLRKQLENQLPSLPLSCLDESIHGETEICNSEEAKRIKALGKDSTVKRLTFTLHADEVAVGNSSTAAIFPIFITINEMNNLIRRENFFLTGLFVGTKKPAVDLFLTPIVEELNSLADSPITWKDSNQEDVSATFHLVAVIADAPMRAYLRNVRQFNHKHGCDWCRIEATSHRKARLYKNLPIEQIQALSRTKEDFILYEKHLSGNNDNGETDKFVGMIGLSPLLKVNQFDIVRGFAVEPMHCIVLGIFRSLIFRGWLKSEVKQVMATGIDRNLFKREFGSRLQSVRVPTEFPRPTRNFDYLKFWKSSEYDSLLCYYFFSCAKGLIAPRAFHNICCLIRIFSIINFQVVDLQMRTELTNLISEFQKGVEILYDKNQLTYNLHILSHLPESVAALGQFASLSAYPLENKMGILKEKVRRTSNVAQNLVRVFLNDCKHKEMMESLVKTWCLSAKEHRVFKTNHHKSEIITTIAEDSTQDIDESRQVIRDLLLLRRFDFYDSFEHIQFHKSMCVKSVRYSTQNYSLQKTRDDSVLKLKDGNFFRIIRICSINGNYFFYGKLFESRVVNIKFKGYTNTFNFTLDHIHEIIEKDPERLEIITLEMVKTKGIFINSRIFNYKYPNNLLIEQFLQNK